MQLWADCSTQFTVPSCIVPSCSTNLPLPQVKQYPLQEEPAKIKGACSALLPFALPSLCSKPGACWKCKAAPTMLGCVCSWVSPGLLFGCLPASHAARTGRPTACAARAACASARPAGTPIEWLPGQALIPPGASAARRATLLQQGESFFIWFKALQVCRAGRVMWWWRVVWFSAVWWAGPQDSTPAGDL